MIANTILAVTYHDIDMQVIATIGLMIFALLTGLIWTGVIALRSIAISLRELADRAGD